MDYNFAHNSVCINGEKNNSFSGGFTIFTGTKHPE